MDQEVAWTKRAHLQLRKVAVYLVDEYGENFANEWLDKLEAKLVRLLKHPLSGMEVASQRGTRRMKIDKHHYLLYKTRSEGIVVRDILPYKRLKKAF